MKRLCRTGEWCDYCNTRRATWQSQVNFKWLCGECNPCWCDYCHGRVDVHGEEAKRLYEAKVKYLRTT